MDSVTPPQSSNYELFPGFWYTVEDKSPQATKDVGQEYDFASIQEAINDADYGDIILVHDGTYHENIVLQGQGLIICSENGPMTTIISGNASGPVVTFENVSRDAMLMGLTITDGYAENGGGILCVNSSPIIAD